MNSKFLLILTLMYICNSKITGQDCLFPPSSVNIELSKATKLKYNNLFSDFEFILPLENEESSIDYIEKMMVVNGEIIVLDKRDGQGDLKIFNKDGQMEKKITFPLEGPFSLTRINDFSICGNQIIVFDNYQRKIIKLNEAYQPIFEHQLKERFENFACGEDYYVFFTGITAQFESDAYLHFYDLGGGFNKKELKLKQTLNNTNFLMEEQNFAKVDNNQNVFFHSFNQEIFSLDKDGIQSVLNFKLAEWISDNDIEKFKTMNITEWSDYANSQKSVTKIMNVIALEEHLFFTINLLGNRYWVFYSFKSQKIKLLKLGYFTDKEFALYSPLAYDHGNFYFLANPNTFLNFYKDAFRTQKDLKGNVDLTNSKNIIEQPLIVKGQINKDFLDF